MSYFLSVLLALFSYINTAQADQLLSELNFSLSQADYTRIGERIYQNECASKPENLLFWSLNERFPSLGIGHFIWLGSDSDEPYEDSFVDMVRFVTAQEPAPNWLLEHLDVSDRPIWKNRAQFRSALKTQELRNLQQWLMKTHRQQAEFIVQRFYERLQKMLNDSPRTEQAILLLQLQRLMTQPKSIYALIDYGNFKGFGDNLKEHYQGEGWGLKQVLLQMHRLPDKTLNQSLDKLSNKTLETRQNSALAEFVEAAKLTLNRRIQLAPKNKNESRWKKGWFKRLDSYLR